MNNKTGRTYGPMIFAATLPLALTIAVPSTCGSPEPAPEPQRERRMLCQEFTAGVPFDLDPSECVERELWPGLTEYRDPAPIYCKCVVWRGAIKVEDDNWILRGCKPESEFGSGQ